MFRQAWKQLPIPVSYSTRPVVGIVFTFISPLGRGCRLLGWRKRTESLWASGILFLVHGCSRRHTVYFFPVWFLDWFFKFVSSSFSWNAVRWQYNEKRCSLHNYWMITVVNTLYSSSKKSSINANWVYMTIPVRQFFFWYHDDVSLA